MSSPVFLDIECYINYFLIYFKGPTKSRYLELFNNKISGDVTLSEIKTIMSSYLTIGFNSNNYDLTMLCGLFKKQNNLYLKTLSDAIITSGESIWDVKKRFEIVVPKQWDHIDIMKLPAHLEEGSSWVGLKLYGARMHTKTIKDLPFKENEIIKPTQLETMREYCHNDLVITEELYNKVLPDIQLRKAIGEKYGLDLRSKSNSSIGEAIFRKECKFQHNNHIVDTNTIYNYIPPKNIYFETKELSDFKEELSSYNFSCTETGKLLKPKELSKKKIIIDDIPYTVGLGGLHSNESCRTIETKDDEFLLDVDVKSYYPTMILNNNYTPKHLGFVFLDIYRRYYNDKIQAGIDNNTLLEFICKIILNAVFGKYGSRFSIFFAPELLFSTTLTGQLNLLRLIEMIHLYTECKVVSANTDGVTIFGKRSNLDKLSDLISRWENEMKYSLEKVFYKALYTTNVSRYIAVKEDLSIKSKGFGIAALNKNPDIEVCYDAVISYIRGGSYLNHIWDTDDIRKYLTMAKVSNGATWKGEYLGRIVRWYYSNKGDIISNFKTKGQVPNSHSAMPCMTLPKELPKDLDKGIYMLKTTEMLQSLGAL